MKTSLLASLSLGILGFLGGCRGTTLEPSIDQFELSSAEPLAVILAAGGVT